MPEDSKTGAKPSTEVSLDQVLQLLKENKSPQQNAFWYFVSSGFFFMLVGGLILFAAFATLHSTHSSLTFMLVVVGVAMLLYGTGTQGAGNIQGAAGEAKYRISIAGGAGVLAFCVGLGIVWKADSIKQAFQIERNYVRLHLQAANDGVSTFEDYVPEVTVDGVAAPVRRNGDGFVVYLPYYGTGQNAEVRLSARFHYVGPEERRNKSLQTDATIQTVVPIEKVVDDGSLDFPRHPNELPVTLAKNQGLDNIARVEEIRTDGENLPPPLPALVDPR